MEAAYRPRESVFARVMADRADWEAATRAQRHLAVAAEDPGYGSLGQAFPSWTRSPTGAILQPPKSEIRPSSRVLERILDRDADMEAGE